IMVYGPLATDVALFLVQCMLILALSRMTSWLFSKIKQPPVIAEIISGIILGPTLLGKVPHFSSTLFPAKSVTYLNMFAQIGLLFFMFIIGLELDPSLFRSHVKESAMISCASIIIPFGLGLASSVYLAHIQQAAWTYSLGIFVGVALSITAFPVLARILTAKKMLSTPVSKVGILAISCAAINDICGWILLGLSVSLVGGGDSLATLWTLLGSAGFVVVMLFLVRPLLSRTLRHFWRVPSSSSDQSTHLLMSCIVFLLFLASWTTEIIGIHAMFGAFTLGAIIPKEGGFNQSITEKIEDLILVFLLPLYFVISGLKTDLSTLNTGEAWLGVLLIVSCATFGKVVGSGVVAFLLGRSKRDSLSVGILMNTRGLVELIVLNLGLDFGIINAEVFGILVLMAIITTLMTSPLISTVSNRFKANNPDDFTVVLCTSQLNIGQAMVDLGFVISDRTTATAIRRKMLKKLYLLPISEVSERPSDFMNAIRKDAKSSLNSLVEYSRNQMKLKLSIHGIVADSDSLASEITSFSSTKNARLIVLGSRPCLEVDQLQLNDLQDQLLNHSMCPVGIFTDRSSHRLPGPQRFKRILLGYMGGSHPLDRYTLDIINKMADTDNVLITIIVFDNDLFWISKVGDKTADGGGCGGLSPEVICTPSVSFANNGTPVGIDSSIGLSGSSIKSSTDVIANTLETKDQYGSHLESVINGKNKNKITVLYKPWKNRHRELINISIHYDLLVVPSDDNVIVESSTPGVIQLTPLDNIKRSISMVHLSGNNRYEEIGVDVAEGGQSTCNTLENSQASHTQQPIMNRQFLEGSTGINYNQSSNDNGSDIDMMMSTRDVDVEVEVGGHSPSSSCWSKCPISTLVIHCPQHILNNNKVSCQDSHIDII
ncbi:hypothetical protein SAMD00019534_115920, partial [Acytostelium subglobosum LB1]|uniref:hypothetical protein n=1 Tax=Acytostelium subglobosum LB1 TaxID=1410327 RepID=UPI0006449570